MGIHKSTVGRIINKFNITGSAEMVKKGGDRRSILTNEHKDFIKKHIDDDCTITIKSIINLLQLNFGICVSRNTVSKAISDFHYTMKKISIVPIARNSIENIEKRKK